MDAFNYLSVLISLILGLAITQVLKGIRGLMHARMRLRMYWPTVLWAILVVVIAVQAWWAMFGLRAHGDWTFVQFSVVLAQTIVVYLLAALVLPDIFGNEVVDLREHYDGQRRWFFALIVVLIVTSLGKNLILDGTWPRPLDLAFHLVFAVAGIAGATIAVPRFHKALALFGVAIIGAYIALLFSHLA